MDRPSGRRRRRLLPTAFTALTVLTFALGILTTSAAAMTFDWTGTAADGEFTNPNNWSPVGVPGSSDEAFFNIPAVPPPLLKSRSPVVCSTSYGSAPPAMWI